MTPGGPKANQQGVHVFNTTAALTIQNMRRASGASSDYTKRVLRGLAAGLILSVLISAGVWALAQGIDSKTHSEGTWIANFCLLFAGILFHYTIYRKVTKVDEALESPRWGRLLAATVSLRLWFGVGWAGRFIAFI